MPRYLADLGLDDSGRAELLESFLSYVREERLVDLPWLLGAPWRRIRRWARETALPR